MRDAPRATRVNRRKRDAPNAARKRQRRFCSRRRRSRSPRSRGGTWRRGHHAKEGFEVRAILRVAIELRCGSHPGRRPIGTHHAAANLPRSGIRRPDDAGTCPRIDGVRVALDVGLELLHGLGASLLHGGDSLLLLLRGELIGSRLSALLGLNLLVLLLLAE